MPSDQTLYIATTNAGKLRDFVTAAAQFRVKVEPLPGRDNIPEPVEDGETFEANARLKAEYYSRLAPGFLVLADDSGLEVDALAGAPGVRSARYAADRGFTGDPGMTTDQRNNACLIANLASQTNDSMADEKRLYPARYRCVLALARDGITERTAEGRVEGAITLNPRGTGGFGYDSLFWLPEHNQTMAECDPQTKQQISHRGRAFRALLQQLQESFASPNPRPAFS